jgi:histidyl-tRNA synthetase
MEAEAQGVEFTKDENVKIYLVGMSENAGAKISQICYQLRLNGIGCERDLMNRSFKSQMKYAGKKGIPFLAVIGDDELSSGEVKVKNMADGSETPVKLDELTAYLADK